MDYSKAIILWSRTMDLDSLRCFLAVAETRHFRSAAGRVALSPAAFSERVARLEEALGQTLLQRSTRRVALTPAGERLLPHARRLLDEAARCAAVAAGNREPEPFELHIGSRAELAQSWLWPALRPLAEARPERRLHILQADGEDLLERVGRGLCDAAVLSLRLTRPHLRYALLHEERYALVARPDLTGPDFSAAEAPNYALLDASPDLPLARYLFDASPPELTWRFARHHYLGGIGIIREAALEGMGLCVLPRYFIAADLEAGRLAPLCPELRMARDWFRLVWRQQHPREPELRRLAEELRALPLK